MYPYHRALERGQGLVEYALILVLIAIAVIVILSVVGKQIGQKFCDIAIELGATASPGVEVCAAPHIRLDGIAGNQVVSGSMYVEAVVRNIHGLMTSNISVDFLIDGVSKVSEHIYKYCMGSGDSVCSSYDISGLTPGPHTLEVIATDTLTNLTGETVITFIVAG